MNDSSISPLSGSLEAECPGGLDWAWYVFGECIRSTRDKVSIVFGVISIAAWFLFALPQILENYRKKIPDAAVSEFLLVFWLLGDTLNFVGGFLTGLLFLQKFLAGYTVLVDLILMGQYYYYKRIHRKNLKREIKIGESDLKSDLKGRRGKILTATMLGCVALCAIPVDLQTREPTLTLGPPSYAKRRLFESPANATVLTPIGSFISTAGEQIGYVFGWISAIMYILGRCHQIFLNWRRKSTDGLSFYLFFLAVLGNTFYSAQIFVKSIDAVFVLTTLPWILGSLGILVFDACILLQFFKYRKQTCPEDPEVACKRAEENPSSGR